MRYQRPRLDRDRIRRLHHRATYAIVIDPALASAWQLLDEVGVPRARFVVSSPTVWRLHGATLITRDCAGRTPILVPDGERAKTLQTVGRIYDALVAAGRIAARSSSPSAAASSATWPASPRRRTCAASPSSTCRRRCWRRWTARRRQGRREPPARQEPDRRISPAAPRRRRSARSPRCRAASSAPGCTRW